VIAVNLHALDEPVEEVVAGGGGAAVVLDEAVDAVVAVDVVAAEDEVDAVDDVDDEDDAFTQAEGQEVRVTATVTPEGTVCVLGKRIIIPTFTELPTGKVLPKLVTENNPA